jgi:hypothetical protein
VGGLRRAEKGLINGFKLGIKVLDLLISFGTWFCCLLVPRVVVHQVELAVRSGITMSTATPNG